MNDRNLRDPRINWDRHSGRFFVVVDPHGATLYLDYKAYLKQTRTWDSSELSWTLLATPDDVRPEGPSSAEPEAQSQAPSNLSTKPSNGSKTSPPVPRWRNWASRVVSSYRKWASKPAGRLHSPSPRDGGGSKSTPRRLKIVGNTVFPNVGNFVRLLNQWQSLLTNLVGKPLFDYSRHSAKASHFLLRLYKSNGLLYVIKFLKVSYIVVLKYLSGERLKTTAPLGLTVGLTNGLPKWFPLIWREWIRSETIYGIRFVLSFLYIYKALDVRTDPDLSTIESEPFTGSVSEFKEFCAKTLEELGIRKADIGKLAPTGYASVAKGVNTPTISAGIRSDAVSWFLKGLDSSNPLHMFMTFLSDYLENENYFPNHWLHWFYESVIPREDFGESAPDNHPRDVGRIATFSDGGGKNRVVALPDWWTQLLLKPIHQYLMDVLSQISQDATFDQDGKLNEFVQRGYKCVWSLDLKAATDLLPQQLYVAVLSHLLGTDLAELWLGLLVNRDYAIRRGKVNVGSVRYTRGQPMGALSSWPSMALVHHLIVLYAAHRAGYNPAQFIDYLVLGDDVVIANERVAREYVAVVELLGGTISMPKSFMAQETGLLQFASQVYFRGVNISPTSFRQEVNCVKPVDRLAQSWSILNRWYPGEGLARLIRLMVPRSLWPEISQSLRAGESHPFVQLLCRTILVPGTTISGSLASMSTSIYGFASTFVDGFSYGRLTNTLDARKESCLLPAVEASVVRELIIALIDNTFGPLKQFSAALEFTDQRTGEDENVVAQDFYWNLLPSLTVRLERCLNKLYPALGRLKHAIIFDKAPKFDTILSQVLDITVEITNLSNFVNDVLGPSSKSLERSRLVTRYNLESKLVPRSLWRTLTDFNITIERLSQASARRAVRTKSAAKASKVIRS